ncbi:MAG: alcohol dehydrogenase catalytic domain-containing protein [Defluviicoccus sp.]|nr:alcohol dehydrogenase catalytic domain-containing protein [Defluviicoccus sp.]
MADHAFAAVLTGPRKFDYREVAIPEVGADDGVLRMEAAGICGTDYEQYDGRLGASGRGLFPIVPGHEIFGWIDRAGPDALRRWGVKEGDRVIVETSIGCGECRYCRDNRTVLCDNNMGYGLRMGFDTPPHLWGGYASHLYLHPRTRLHRAPDDIPTDALSLFNPLSNAVRWAGERPRTRAGDTVVIAGPGQRGLLSVVVARELGAGQVIVTGTGADARRLELARALGADATIDVSREDPVERVLALTGGHGADVVVDVSAHATEPLLQAVDMVRKGGNVVVAGLKTDNALNDLYTDKLVFREISLLGVLSSDWNDTVKAIDILKTRWRELAVLCTHSYPVAEAEKAVRVLGREIADGPEPVHIHIDTAEAP